jgi:peroxiredoxin
LVRLLALTNGCTRALCGRQRHFSDASLHDRAQVGVTHQSPANGRLLRRAHALCRKLFDTASDVTSAVQHALTDTDRLRFRLFAAWLRAET